MRSYSIHLACPNFRDKFLHFYIAFGEAEETMRESCVSCGRPHRVCLCTVLPRRPINTATRVIILQHPHESRHKLATVPIVARCLSNCEIVVGRRFKAGSCHLLDECALKSALYSSTALEDSGSPAGESLKCLTCGQKSSVLLLFPTRTATDLRTWCQSTQHVTCSSPSETVASGSLCLDGGEEGSSAVTAIEAESNVLDLFADLSLISGLHGQGPAVSEEATVTEGKCGDNPPLGVHCILLIVDGTWQHAKEMVKASMPFLEDFVLQVSLPHDISQGGWGMGDSDSILRKEPFAGCVSTMEAIARALGLLEPHGSHVENTMLSVLQQMVNLQASHFLPLESRLRMPKKNHCGGKDAQQPA